MKLTGRASAKEAWRDIVLPDDVVGIKINPLGGPELSTHSIIVDKIVEGVYGGGCPQKSKLLSGTGLKTTISERWVSDQAGGW